MRTSGPGDANDRTTVERRDPLVGTILDQRFHIEVQLAAGGFGAIYRATDLRSDAEVALKVLLPQMASDPNVTARFRREGATLSNLRDPHTITAYELGEAPDGTLYIVMELLHGESLYQQFRTGGPLPWRRVVHIARGVCSSLAEAHGYGIVHRDLKPANIHLELRDGDPDFVKVLDFGIAKIVQGSEQDRGSELTQAGHMIGTVDYMSPEQMVGGEMTACSDIYTLGIVLYEMISGRTPFADAQSATAILAAVLTQTPEPLSRHAPVPPGLDVIVARCLARDPQNRWQDVTELDEALAEVESGGLARAALPERVTTAYARQVPADPTAFREVPSELTDPTMFRQVSADLADPTAFREASEVTDPTMFRQVPADLADRTAFPTEAELAARRATRPTPPPPPEPVSRAARPTPPPPAEILGVPVRAAEIVDLSARPAAAESISTPLRATPVEIIGVPARPTPADLAITSPVLPSSAVPSSGFEQVSPTSEATRIDVRFTESSQPVLDVRGPRAAVPDELAPTGAYMAAPASPPPHLAPLASTTPLPQARGSQGAIDAQGWPQRHGRGSVPVINPSQHQLPIVHHAFTPPRPNARDVPSYDMAAAASHDAVVRRIIWISVLAAVIAAILIATH